MDRNESSLHKALHELREDVRREVHSQRSRVHQELHKLAEEVNSGIDPLDIDKPTLFPKPVRHHYDNIISIDKNRKKKFRQKWWKRRKAIRNKRT